MTTPTTPAEHAAAASEAVRALIHAVYAGDGWATTDDLYATVGALRELAGRLNEAAEHGETLLIRLNVQGALVADDELRERVFAALGALGKARSDAAGVYSALGTAHAALGHLGMREGE